MPTSDPLIDATAADSRYVLTLVGPVPCQQEFRNRHRRWAGRVNGQYLNRGDLTDKDNSGEALYPLGDNYSATVTLGGLAHIFKRGSEPQMLQNVLTAVKQETKGHVNRQPFRGLLAWVGIASDGAPSGAGGHRVILSRIAAENAINSLLGMGIDHHSSGVHHDPRRKVGVITHAEVAGPRLEFAGYLFAKDFPEVVDLVRAGRSSDYGFSYLMTDAAVKDKKAKVWEVVDGTFTGAALIRKDRAAYKNTWIELI